MKNLQSGVHAMQNSYRYNSTILPAFARVYLSSLDTVAEQHPCDDLQHHLNPENQWTL